MLEGKRIIVTGAARGIGAATLRAYVDAGATVAAFDVLDSEGEAAVAAANAQGQARAFFFHCDVASREGTLAAVDSAAQAMGGLDVLAHCAGIERSEPAEDISADHWDQVIAINITGTMLMNQAVFPHMKAGGGGRILNFGSHAGMGGMAGSAAYAASKGAVLAWTRTVAREWGRHNIAVNALAPGIWTPMYDLYRSRLTEAEIDVLDAGMRERIPLGGKLGDPAQDMAPVMVFLASDGARFITGQTIPVDGGLYIMS